MDTKKNRTEDFSIPFDESEIPEGFPMPFETTPEEQEEIDQVVNELMEELGIDMEVNKMGKELRRELEEMPIDKVFFTENGEELCHATGFEVCNGNPNDPSDWWNEYEDSEGDFHYGR